MNQKIQFQKTTGIRKLDNEFKENIIKEDNTFKEILIDKLKRNTTWKNIKRAIQNYLRANFVGIEEETIKFVIGEMKGSFRRYNVIDVRGYGDKYVIAYPIYRIPYSLMNKVTYRIIVLLAEYERAYSVINNWKISVDLSKDQNGIYDYYEVSEGIYNTLDTILGYNYETIDKNAYINLDELEKRALIRVQGDLVFDYELMDRYMLESFIKSGIKDMLGVTYVNDLVRYISRKLSLNRVEHGIQFQDRHVLLIIPVNKGEGNYVNKFILAMEKLLGGEIGLSKNDYDLNVIYRCPYGSSACEYIIRLSLVPYRLVEILNSNDIVEELAEMAMKPVKYNLNIGNHNVSFIGYDNSILLDMNLPFSGDRFRQYVRWTSNWYYIDNGIYDITINHNEHGENRLKIESEDYIAFRWLTIVKPRAHELIRNKIALRHYLSRYA